MKKIFYWSPYLSNVATIGNVLNSAYSLSKYGKSNFNINILDVLGEWTGKKKNLLDNNINYIKLGRLTIELPISGFLKSRFISIVLFITNIFPL